jgi:hypothetical protein
VHVRPSQRHATMQSRTARLGAALVVGVLLVVGDGVARPESDHSAGVLADTVVQPGQDQGAQQPWPIPSPAEPPVNPTRRFIVAPPQLETARPSGDGVPVNAFIVATFSQPMDRGSVERSFAIRPHVSGQLAWADDFSIRFQPDRLLHGVVYQVEIGGRSARGMPLTGQYGWRFRSHPQTSRPRWTGWPRTASTPSPWKT